MYVPWDGYFLGNAVLMTLDGATIIFFLLVFFLKPFGVYRSYCNSKVRDIAKSRAQLTPMRNSVVVRGSRRVVKHKTIFSSAIGHSGAHWRKLRTTFGYVAYF